MLDRSTHENSALVGQMVTTVSSLSEKARDPVHAVGAFKVGGYAHAWNRAEARAVLASSAAPHYA
ncbi:hypothetical protein QF002_001143 [Paraburkholderia youngii]